VYELKSGNQRGKVFGSALAVTDNGDRLLVENRAGVVDLYDALTLRPLEHFAFPSRVAHAEFAGPDDLLILTADQTVYQFNLGAEQVKSSTQ